VCALDQHVHLPERALPDGKSVPFAVPKGKVLIVRHVSYELFSNMVGAPLDVSVVAGVGGSLYAYAVRTVLTDPSGVTSLEFEFPVGSPSRKAGRCASAARWRRSHKPGSRGILPGEMIGIVSEAGENWNDRSWSASSRRC